jgi:hypothetical protein
MQVSPAVVAVVAVLAATAVSSGCSWVSLAANAAAYETLAPGEAGNVAVRDALGYLTLADSGFAVVDAESGTRIRLVPPPAGLESVDDIAVDGAWLFVLDARPPGALAILSLNDPADPSVASPAVSVPVGPFSGVSAAGGVVVVSGGTSRLTAWSLDSRATLAAMDTIDLGRGQPDVLVAPGGVLYVSTHYRGSYFGLDVVRRDATSAALTRVAQVELKGAGFTAGGAKPANFPVESALLDATTLLVAHRNGLAEIDVTRPDSARIVRVIDVGGPAVNVDARDGVVGVAVGGRAPAVALVERVSGSLRVVRRVTLPPGTKPTAVALSRRSVLVAARGQGTLVVKR